MTANELRSYFHEQYGAGKYPDTYEVDAETYGNVCQAIFNHIIETQTILRALYNNGSIINVSLGPHNGIMFRNVELILKGS